METLYIIGGSGFIGKNIVRNFYEIYNIIVIDKYIDYTYFESFPKIKTVQLDLVENEIPTNIKSPDYIMNLASVVTAERDLNLFNNLIKSNLSVLINLFNRFKSDKQLKLFVQFGSSEEYGTAISPFLETVREEPNSPYALIKQLTTNTSIMLYHNYGFPTVVVRPGNLFGPLQNSSKFIPYVIEKLQNNEPLNVSLCEQKRDFIHVDDFSNLIREILLNYQKSIGNIINVSSGESISLKEIIEIFKEKIQSTSKINYGALPYRENEMMDLKCDIGKLRQICSFEINALVKNRLIQSI